MVGGLGCSLRRDFRVEANATPPPPRLRSTDAISEETRMHRAEPDDEPLWQGVHNLDAGHLYSAVVTPIMTSNRGPWNAGLPALDVTSGISGVADGVEATCGAEGAAAPRR